MSQRIILDGLWCGQGMANMVRVFKSEFTDPKTNPSDWLCVFDFGSGGLSESKKELGITPPVRFMMEQLKLQQKAGRTPQIDLLVISHQDRDHWQLLRELNEQIEAEEMTVIVGRMILGGANWRQSSTNAVMKFYDRVPDPGKNVTWYDSEYSSYYDPEKPVPTISIGDMQLSLLVTNVAAADTSDDIERNCSSAVVLLRLPSLFGYGYGFILPGDATWETFARLKVIMAKWPTKPLPAIYAASVPHHGALRTMNRNSGNPRLPPDLQDLIWFTDYTRPSSIYASAGIYNTHSHPYRIVMETMARFAGFDQFHQRSVVRFNGATDEFEIQENVRQNVYTTVLNLTSPAQTANWIFDITSIKNSTDIQLFEAGVPAILSAPELSEMELAAQRVNAEGNGDMDTGSFLSVDFADSPVMLSPTVAAEGAPAAAATVFAPMPWLANRAPSVRAYHWPLATADAARVGGHPAPPPRRVRAGAPAGLSLSG